MRGILQDVAPESAEIHGNIKLQRIDHIGSESEGSDCCWVKAWRGKAKNPFAFVSFDHRPNPAGAREEWITEAKEGDDAAQAFKASQKREKAARVLEERKQYQVGTLLVYSWGYDQTNIDFFQVVERVGKATVLIRPIAHGETAGTAPMAGWCKPDRDNFIGPPVKKVIGAWGISMPHGSCSITDEDKQHYESWYA